MRCEVPDRERGDGQEPRHRTCSYSRGNPVGRMVWVKGRLKCRRESPGKKLPLPPVRPIRSIESISKNGPMNRRSLHCAPPDFLWRPVTLGICMVVASSAKYGIRVRFGRDDKGRRGVLPGREVAERICGARSRLEGKACGIPHLAKNERDVGHPAIGAGIKSKTASGKSFARPYFF